MNAPWTGAAARTTDESAIIRSVPVVRRAEPRGSERAVPSPSGAQKSTVAKVPTGLKPAFR